MPGDVNLAAVLQHRTGGTPGQGASTNVLSERDQQPVYLDPVPLWKLFLERLPGPLRGLRLYVAPAVRHALDVDVHTDPALTFRDAKCQIRAFGPDAVKRHQDFRIGWQRSAKFLDRADGNVVDLLGLSMMKRRGPDEIIDPGYVEARDFLRTPSNLEEPDRRWQAFLIARAN